MIEVHLDCATSRGRDGMRRWLAYLQNEVVQKMKGHVVLKDNKPNHQTYLIGDSLCTFSISTGEGGNVLVITLQTNNKKTGSLVETAPVPALVILMVMLHLLPGRKDVGAMVPIQATIAGKFYNTRAQIPEIYRSLKSLVPEKWYVPFSEGIKTPEEFFKRS